MLSLAFVALAAAVAPAHAFFRMGCAQPVVVERADPIVTPGAVATHLHQVLGGNGFNFNQSFADARKSSCSTCQARADLSNYWTPNLFFRAKNGTFHNVNQIGGGTVYYLQRRGDDSEKLNAFPENFRMLAGNPALRSFTNTLEQQAVSFVCLDYAGSGAGGQFTSIPNHICPNGLRAQVFFPSCWDGKNVDSADHKSHMAYPDRMDSGKCPSSHPVRLISIFYEITFDVAQWKDEWWVPAGATQPFVLSNGDPIGYSFHGDFLMGWDKAVLQAAIDGCTADSGVIEDCQNILSLRTNDEMNDCAMPSRVPEQTTGWINQLPGCNPVTNGPGNAPAVSGCGAVTSILPAAEASFLRTDIAGWKPVGCAIDNGSQRVLSQRWTNGAMTTQSCTAHCASQGYSFAGLEWAQECWCGNTLDQSKIGNYACDMPCQGDSSQYCGQSQRLAVYAAGDYKPAAPPSATIPASTKPTSTAVQTSTPVKTTSTSTPAKPSSTPAKPSSTPAKPTSTPAKPTSTSNKPTVTPTPTKSSSVPSKPTSTSKPAQPSSPVTTNPTLGWYDMGCFTDNRSGRVLTGINLWANQPMTPAVCIAHCNSLGFQIAGVEYGQECYCGHTLVNHPARVDAGECNMACKGDSKQKCGAGDRIHIYEKPAGMAKREHRRRRRVAAH